MKTMVKALALGAILGLAGCSSQVAVSEGEAKFQLYVDVTPREAIIIVDDVAMGTGEHTLQVPLRVTAGTRRVAIVCDGYHPFKTTLEYIQPGEVYTLTTHLIASEF